MEPGAASVEKGGVGVNVSCAGLPAAAGSEEQRSGMLAASPSPGMLYRDKQTGGTLSLSLQHTHDLQMSILNAADKGTFLISFNFELA